MDEPLIEDHELVDLAAYDEDMPAFVDVVLTRPPGPDSDFVDLEDPTGRSLGLASGAHWVDRGDGYAVLRIPAVITVNPPVEAPTRPGLGGPVAGNLAASTLSEPT